MAKAMLLPALELDIAAMTYFVEYLMTDLPCINSLSQNGSAIELKALELEFVANAYLVSRTLPNSSKDGEIRLLQAVKLLLAQRKPTESSVAGLVTRFATELGKIYPFEDKHGKQMFREPLSTASKFLWMYFQSPVVIYDALAVRWIRITHKAKTLDYATYLALWRVSYVDHCEAIEEACDNLGQSPIAQSISKTHCIGLNELCKKQWFLERVFDHAIVRSASQQSAELVRVKRSSSLQWKDV